MCQGWLNESAAAKSNSQKDRQEPGLVQTAQNKWVMESFHYLQNDRLVIIKTETLPGSSSLSLELWGSPSIFFPLPTFSTEN